MPNSQTQGGFVKKSGDTMTGNLNIGLNSLIMNNGVNGGVIRGNSATPDYLEIVDIAESGYANMLGLSLNLAGVIAMQAGMTVDGVDISEKLFEIIEQNGIEYSLTGSVNETILRDVSVGAGVMGVLGSLRIRAAGHCTGNNGSKTLKLLFGGVEITSVVIAASATTMYWEIFATIINRNSESSQATQLRTFDDTSIEDAKMMFTSVDTALAKTLSITGQLVNAADYAYLDNYLVELSPSG